MVAGAACGACVDRGDDAFYKTGGNCDFDTRLWYAIDNIFGAGVQALSTMVGGEYLDLGHVDVMHANASQC